MNVPSLKGIVSPEEWALRCDLAACYRLAALYGWTDLVFTHISARIPGTDDEFLINPYGLMFEEITASSLIRVDQHGNKLNESPFDVNRAGFVIHSAVHTGRPDVQCVLHTHTRAGIAVSAQECGLLPISQQATFALGSIGYHKYEGVALYDEEKPRLQADLGNASCLILRNHGLLTVGRNIPNAFLAMYNLESACQIQISAQAGGALIRISEPILKSASYAASKQTEGVGGDFVWPALLRKLARVNPGYEI
jgi:ribulose-5-phosphate 4-epimerase/fuculose-1-phosphate aldolase